MSGRLLLLFLCFWLVLAGCKNEPYSVGPLSIAALTNKATGGATLNFTYRASKLRTFTSKSSTANHSMIFYFIGDTLKFITGDSTADSFSRTKFYLDGLSITDSTFLYPRDSICQLAACKPGDSVSVITDTTFVSTRTVIYGTDENPIQIKTSRWNEDDVQTDEQVDITWENGNVSRLFTTTKTGGVVSLRDEIATYDDKKSVYTKRKEYIYTMSNKDFFWLSTNNPIMFNSGTGERVYGYSYNSQGYPSAYTSNIGTKYGMTYNQVP